MVRSFNAKTEIFCERDSLGSGFLLEEEENGLELPKKKPCIALLDLLESSGTNSLSWRTMTSYWNGAMMVYLTNALIDRGSD